jgi:hypothetical protein
MIVSWKVTSRGAAPADQPAFPASISSRQPTLGVMLAARPSIAGWNDATIAQAEVDLDQRFAGGLAPGKAGDDR